MEQIEEIGLKRAPNEACGLLLGVRGKRTRVVELPNRSLTPLDGYVLQGEDMRMVVEGEDEVDSVAAWHTHPQGLVGPSRRDMQCRPEVEVPMLVVALTEEGAVPTWF